MGDFQSKGRMNFLVRILDPRPVLGANITIGAMVKWAVMEENLKILLLCLSVVLSLLSIIHMAYKIRNERRKNAQTPNSD
jgi:hypothetical protein